MPQPLKPFLLLAGLCLLPIPSAGQDSGEVGTLGRGDRAEIAVAVRDSSGGLITAPATVKLYKNGVPIDQSSTVRGRAFFVPRALGDFTVIVEATGYKPTQKDVSISLPVQIEVDINLQRENAANVSTGIPGQPLLAPKAKEALTKGLQALGQNKLDEAEKHVNEAMKLAPANPEVLYVRGVLYMRRSDWPKAQSVFESVNQIEPNQARTLGTLGLALCNQRKYEEAIPLLEKSIQLDPNASWETEWALAKSYYYREQFEQALNMAQLAHTSSHGATEAELLLAQCLTAVGRYEDSAQVLREFLKNNHGGPDAATAQRWLDRLTADGKIHN